jgi:hypothetical protein
MALWLARKFDFTLGQYTGGYYDIAEAGVVAVFVCSYTGNDTNAGTAAAPFKTLSKAITTLNATGADGSRIFMHGAFSENIPTQTYFYNFIGCGGGFNGKTLFYYNSIANTIIRNTKKGAVFHNIKTDNYLNSANTISSLVSSGGNFNFLNCDITATFAGTDLGTSNSFGFYYCTLINCRIVPGTNFRAIGTKNTIYKILVDRPGSVIRGYFWTTNTFLSFTLNANSFQIYNYVGGSFRASENENGGFINVVNKNFHLHPTSPLLFSGEINEQTGIPDHVGSLGMGFAYDSGTYEATTIGGATVTNLEISNGRLVRTDPNIPGSLETGNIDLGAPYPITQLTVENNFEYDNTGVSKGVFEDLTGSPRPALTILMKYGNTEAERDACPWLEVEYGKRPTYSGSGPSRVGNGDDTFDSDNELTITARYFKYKFTLQDR